MTGRTVFEIKAAPCIFSDAGWRVSLYFDMMFSVLRIDSSDH